MWGGREAVARSCYARSGTVPSKSQGDDWMSAAGVRLVSAHRMVRSGALNTSPALPVLPDHVCPLPAPKLPARPC